MNNEIDVHSEVRVGGVYSFAVYGPDGELRGKALAAESPNLITNAGLDALGGKFGLNYQRYCCVGGSNATPTVGDTSIGSLIAVADYSTAKHAGTSGTEESSPYYTWISRTWRFGEGVAAGNLSEVTVGWNSAGNGIFSRALILDELGDPTTLTILADETLDVTYEFRYYPKLTDDTGTGLVFSGNIGGTYDWTFRAANAGLHASEREQAFNPDTMGWGLGASGNNLGIGSGTRHNARFYVAGTAGRSYDDVVVYDGVIGAITDKPTGISQSITVESMEDFTVSAYVDSSYELNYSMRFGLNQANLAGGIRSIALLRCGIGSYQMQFDPAIPKTNTDKLTINWKLSWGRI